VSLEFWKRKTFEINARWGTLDMIKNEDIKNESEIR
jgi:hypothetical protein